MTFPMNDLVTNKSGKYQFEMEMGALLQEVEIQKQFEKCEMWDSFDWLRQLRSYLLASRSPCQILEGFDEVGLQVGVVSRNVR